MGDSKTSTRANEFLVNFSRAKSLILKRIEELNKESNGGDVGPKLTLLANDIQQISISLHDATLFLPSYSVKVRQEEIRELEKALKEKESLLIPKKKFGFQSKQKEKIVSSDYDISSSNKDTHDSQQLISSKETTNFFTVENRSNSSISLGEEDLNKNDVMVRSIENSILFLNGSPSTLRLSNLKSCKLICGPVFTSVFVENCVDSIFFLSCQQLRVHTSNSLDIYLRVRSRAIIEDCSNIRFSPYFWNHERSSFLHQLTEIGEDLERYDCVDDFNWPDASTKSPNWSIIPDSERETLADWK